MSGYAGVGGGAVKLGPVVVAREVSPVGAGGDQAEGIRREGREGLVAGAAGAGGQGVPYGARSQVTAGRTGLGGEAAVRTYFGAGNLDGAVAVLRRIDNGGAAG